MGKKNAVAHEREAGSGKGMTESKKTMGLILNFSASHVFKIYMKKKSYINMLIKHYKYK